MSIWTLLRAPSPPGACAAQIGSGVPCGKPSTPGDRFCNFHAGLQGPWAKAMRIDAGKQRKTAA